MTTHTCDGCGREVDSAHVRDRILRLEAATRFRPLHIATLLVLEAPPVVAAEDFYSLGAVESASPGADLLRQQFLAATGVKLEPGKSRESQLIEFQRLGFYVAYLWECPLPARSAATHPTGDALAAQIQRLTLRIRFSYKPKCVVLVGRELAPLVKRLNELEQAVKLVLHDGGPVPLPALNDPAETMAFRAAMAAMLVAAAVPGPR